MIKSMFRDDNAGYWPIMIKASQAGALETLLAEAEKIIGHHYKIQIVNTGVGPLTEKDLNEASHIGATIFGFDVPVQANVVERFEDAGVSVHLHKLIYTFQEDLEKLVHDVRQEELLERGQGMACQLCGEASIQQIFNVSVKGAKKMQVVAGSRVTDGLFSLKKKCRVVRDEECI